MDLLCYDGEPQGHARRIGADYCTTRWDGGHYIPHGGNVLSVFQDSRNRRVSLVRWGWEHAGRLLAHGPASALSQRPLSLAWPKHRCLVLAESWGIGNGSGAPPTVVFPFGKGYPFAIGGLWSTCEIAGVTCGCVVILTVPACKELRHLQKEQPVVVIDEHIDRWLDPGATVRDLRPVMASHMFYSAHHYLPDVDQWLKGNQRAKEDRERRGWIYGES